MKVSIKLCLKLIRRIRSLKAQIKYLDWHCQDLQEILMNHQICPDCGKHISECDIFEDQDNEIKKNRAPKSPIF